MPSSSATFGSPVEPVTMKSNTQIQSSTQGSRGFTLTELLIVILIILVLAAILIPSINIMRDRAAAAGCASNMRQCAALATMFTQEQNGRMPRLHVYGADLHQIGKEALPAAERIVNNEHATFWPDLLTTYEEGATMFSCPKLKKPAVNGPGGGFSDRVPLGIGINYYCMASNLVDPSSGKYDWPLFMKVPDPSRIVWFADAAGDVTGPWKDRVDTPGSGSCFFRGHTDDGMGVMPRHGGKINAAFVDGHVKMVSPSEIDWGSRDPSGNYVGFGHF